MSFKGKVVIVTGSSSGIGAATAVEFAKEGADVVITGRNEAKLKKVTEDCAKYGKPPLVVKADISNEAQAKSIIDKAVEKFGKIDVLVNNAGLSSNGSILDEHFMKSYDTIMSTNLRPVFHLTSLAAPHLIKSKGNIVNVSSVLGSMVYRSTLSYCAGKAALDHFTRGAALELSAHGVRVNSVNPGPVRTDIMENAGVNGDWDQVGQLTLLKRPSDSQEIADLIVYVAGDKARGITGSNLLIDNGMALHR